MSLRPGDALADPQAGNTDLAAEAAAAQRTVPRYREVVLQLGLYVALGLLVAFFAFASPYFFTLPNLRNILLQVGVVGMIAIGQTFVIIAGGIDLSVGSVIGLAGIAAGYVALNPDSGALLPILAAIACGGAVGLVNGYVINAFNIPSFIVTLASLSAVRGLALIATDTQNLYGFNEAFKFVGSGSVAGLPSIVWIFLLVFVAAYFFQAQTPFARHMYAVGGDRRAAALFGVSVRRVEVVLFTLSGAIAGLAGAVLAARVSSAEPNAGMGFELTAIAAVIIGGTSLTGGEGGVERTFVGVLILGVISNGLNLLNVPSYYQQPIYGLIIVAAVIVDQWAKRRG
jgi:ribose/xylose/arabinose/galactoside ABC-type transport system permease subunit